MCARMHRSCFIPITVNGASMSKKSSERIVSAAGDLNYIYRRGKRSQTSRSIHDFQGTVEGLTLTVAKKKSSGSIVHPKVLKFQPRNGC